MNGEPTNAVLLERLKSIEQRQEDRHKESAARLDKLEKTVGAAIRDLAQKTADLETKTALNGQQIKSIWKDRAEHAQDHKESRVNQIAIVGILVTAAGVVSYFLALFAR